MWHGWLNPSLLATELNSWFLSPSQRGVCMCVSGAGGGVVENYHPLFMGLVFLATSLPLKAI